VRIDNDLLERALDAAEEKLSTKALDDSSSPDTTQETAPALEETQASTEATNEPKAERVRDATGKFTKGSASKAIKAPEEEAKEQILSDQTANAESGELEKAIDVGEESNDAPAIEAPAFWSAENKTLFAKSPREVQKAISEEAQRIYDWANRTATEAERGKTIEQRYTETVKPYELKLKAQGIDPIQATERLLAWNEVFESDVKLGIADLMRKNGLTPYDFLNDEGQGQSPYQTDPYLEQARADAEAAKRSVEELKAQLDAQQQQAAQSQIEAFKSGTDSSGQVRRAFVDMYKPQIVQTMQTIMQQYPHVTEIDALNHAYEFTMKEVKSMLGVGSAPSAPQTQQAPKPVVDAKKAESIASKSTGAPQSGVVQPKPKLKGNTFAEKFDNAFQNAVERLGAH